MRNFKLLRPPCDDDVEKGVMITVWMRKSIEGDFIIPLLLRQNDLSELSEMKVVSYESCKMGQYLKLDVTRYAWEWLKVNDRKLFLGFWQLTFGDY